MAYRAAQESAGHPSTRHGSRAAGKAGNTGSYAAVERPTIMAGVAMGRIGGCRGAYGRAWGWSADG